MTPEVKAAFYRYLLTVGDDELVLGSRDAEWTGIAPIVEEDVAFSSLAQDEIGHARLFYGLAAELVDGDVDHIAYLRPKNAYYHARLLEPRLTVFYDPEGKHHGSVEWTKAIVRRFLYDIFDDLRLTSLSSSQYEPLAQAVQKIHREERYHLWHGESWWKLLATTSPGGVHLEDALDVLWPDILGLFEDAPNEGMLLAEGIIGQRTSDLREIWFERVYPYFEQFDISFPGSKVGTQWDLRVKPSVGGREGVHGEGWDELYGEMFSVRQIAPEGVW